MKILTGILIQLFNFCLSSKFQSNLYFTQSLVNRLDHHCIYYHVFTDPPIQQVHSYCIRDSSTIDDYDGEGPYQNILTFKQLREQNISSYQLYEWSAPIDLAEDYEVYLETNETMGNRTFYNCTFPWFGTRCQFSFGLTEPLTASEAIHVWIHRQVRVDVFTNKDLFPCYSAIPCLRGSPYSFSSGVCLDWREVCDGKVDCLDHGLDERDCWQLELNECNNEREFRCQNGLCIPRSFYNDDPANPDCLDGSDEPYFDKYHRHGSSADWFFNKIDCQKNPVFHCDERQCHSSLSNRYTTTCGQGDCLDILNQECPTQRSKLLVEALFRGVNVSDECHRYFLCGLNVLESLFDFADYCEPDRSASFYTEKIRKYCPPLLFLPSVVLGHVHLVYNITGRPNCPPSYRGICAPDYICYHTSFCDEYLFPHLIEAPLNLTTSNRGCRPLKDFKIPILNLANWHLFVDYLFKLFRKCSMHRRNRALSRFRKVYQCQSSSQHISYHRLLDKVEDCVNGDDEILENSCSIVNGIDRFSCEMNKTQVCLGASRLNDGIDDCDDRSDETSSSKKNETQTEADIFSKLCDGFLDFPSIEIDGVNVTDESNCSQFPCNNSYTRCNGVWNCPDGADEVNCEEPPFCPSRHHFCISPENKQLGCLPIERINDGHIDCEGATDERSFCQSSCPTSNSCLFRCPNSDQCISAFHLCFQPSLCPNPINQTYEFCKQIRQPIGLRCTEQNLTHIEQFICSLGRTRDRRPVFLPFDVPQNESEQNQPDKSLAELRQKSHGNLVKIALMSPARSFSSICNRGVGLFFKKSPTEESEICFCPPGSSGRFCSNQTDRVVLTFRVIVSSDWKSSFSVVSSLFDVETDRLESSEKIDFSPWRDCSKKFNVYLLFGSRWKNVSSKFEVRIDVFNRKTFEHRTSLSLPVNFVFLPVSSFSVEIFLPTSGATKRIQCGEHGRLVEFSNVERNFCLCDSGWSGKFCNVSFRCECSSDSICLNEFQCLCPIGSFGKRCFLQEKSHCASSSCFNEKNRSKIEISFERRLESHGAFIFHFVQNLGRFRPAHFSTVFKKLYVDQNRIEIFRSAPFHFVFLENSDTNFFLLFFHRNFRPKQNFHLIVQEKNRCKTIRQHFLEQHRRIEFLKSFHRFCQENFDFNCFIDEHFICVCDPEQNRTAICFPFNSTRNSTTERPNPCENGARFIVDDQHCPTESVCICPECFHGSRCQFSSFDSFTSLDVVLGYLIRSGRSLNEQNLNVKLIFGIMTCFLAFGLISNILSIRTFGERFQRKKKTEFFLLTASLSSFLVMISLTMKFYILIFHQIGWIRNHSFFWFHCVSIEFILRVFVSTSEWFMACVSFDRTLTGVLKFGKVLKRVGLGRKSISFIIFISVLFSYLHDPIHRNVFVDEEESKVWCVVQFNVSCRRYDSAISFVHLFAPFSINFGSALILILKVTRQRSVAQKRKSYREHLIDQCSQLKHILLSPLILVILSIPRLIISLLTGCVKSTRNPWLFLTGYIVSFSPSVLTFFVFVVTSKAYRTHFYKTFQFRRRKPKV